MNNPNSYPQSPESEDTFKRILRQHAAEQFRTGIYASWIELVDRYYGGNNPKEQKKLSAFARSEMPLAAAVWRDIDNRYPGVNAYFLVKVDLETGERVKYGPYGTEPIIVAHADNAGNIVEIREKGRPETYTDEQVQVVVRQAHELEAAGFTPNPLPHTVGGLEHVGRSVSW